MHRRVVEAALGDVRREFDVSRVQQGHRLSPSEGRLWRPLYLPLFTFSWQ
jgi:hypothetical protein